MATFRFDLNQEYSERLEADAAAKRMNIQEYIRYKLFGEVTIFSVFFSAVLHFTVVIGKV